MPVIRGGKERANHLFGWDQGGGPFIMEIAYHPDDRARQWAMFMARVQAYQTALHHLLGGYNPLEGNMTATAFGHSIALKDALGEILAGDWSVAKACAYRDIVLTLAQHHIWGTPLPSMTTPMGGPSAFALALHVFETGEEIVLKVPTLPEHAYPEEEEEYRGFLPFFGGLTPPPCGGNGSLSLWGRLKVAAYAISPVLGGALTVIENNVNARLKLAATVIGAATSLWNSACAKLQQGIDFVGEGILGERWTKMRETINFQNPNVQNAIEVIGWGLALLEPTPFGEYLMGARAAWRASRLFRTLNRCKFGFQFIFDKRLNYIKTIGISILFPGRRALLTLEMHVGYWR